jgi:NAD(P)-dependent dehydrogenase (short-subunit alcohol dehydrogenase family)
MNLGDKLRYDGKRVLVVGGATGMGAAGAELANALGAAEVIVMDVAKIDLPKVTAVHVDLADKGSIDAALRKVEGRIDAVFAAAGVAEGTPGIERVNFVGHRYLIERLIETGQVSRGAAVCLISSSAGLGWEADFRQLSELLDLKDFQAAADWLVSHGMASYMGTKRAVCAYVAREATSFLKRGIRLNAICPGPTDTPLARANFDQWLGAGTDFRAEVGVEAHMPIEQAYPMAFLCSDAASAITGLILVSDLNWFNAGHVGSFPPATPIAEFLLGRPSPMREPT